MSVLSGLKTNPNVAAAQKGMDAQADAARGMESAQFDQDMAMKRAQQQTQERQQRNQLNAQQADSASSGRMQKMQLGSRMGNINMGRAFDYAGLQKRNQMRWQQALLNNLAGDM